MNSTLPGVSRFLLVAQRDHPRPRHHRRHGVVINRLLHRKGYSLHDDED